MRPVSNVAVLMFCACSTLQIAPFSRDFCRPQPVLLVGSSDATAQLATNVQRRLGPQYPLAFEPTTQADHLTVTVVEYDYRQLSKQVQNTGGGFGGSVPIAVPQYEIKYEPEATVRIRVQSLNTSREYTGLVTGVPFRPSESPGIPREQLLDLASKSAVQQFANDLKACDGASK